MKSVIRITGISAIAVVALAVITISLCSGCAVVAVADAVVTTGAVIVKTGVKATGAVINAVIP